MKTVTQSIADFLNSKSVKVDLYAPGMEVQVNVVAGKERKADEKRLVWCDDNHEWSPIRIPHNSGGSDAHYVDRILGWPLENYAEAIGCTGWDWSNRVSRWVGFDFDSITNHARGLSETELAELRDKVKEVPWITVRRSTSGKGLHLYVFLDPVIHTNNHTEHTVLAKAILSQLSSLLSFDFSSKVDTAGGVLWIWHKKASKELRSFEVIKEGVPLSHVPSNWHETITVKRKRVPTAVAENATEFTELLAKIKRVTLDDEHRQLLTWFANQKVVWWYDAERNMLVCHTFDLKRAHDELKLKGIFFTNSRGKDSPTDQNCFCFPQSSGGWVVRRHSIGASEHPYWSVDASGWRYCYFNRSPSLAMAANTTGGTKKKDGSFVFKTMEEAASCLGYLKIDFVPPEGWKHRETVIAYGKNENDIVISTSRFESDDTPEGWYGNKKQWEYVATCIFNTIHVEAPDDLVRHVVDGNDSYWVVNSRDGWVEKTRGDITSVLLSLNYKRPEIEKIYGQAVLDHWKVVSKPFDSEYPGDRCWNKLSAQFSVEPRAGPHPHWTKILNHIGSDLEVGNSDWCVNNGILDGGTYLLLWIASMFKYPYEPLPYLSLYGEQGTGKSILHEALSMAFRNRVGYTGANAALLSPQGFNGELYGAVLCVCEELDLRKGLARDRIKDWVTGKTISIHGKNETPFNAPNTTHWIQCANPVEYTPIFSGDTRIILCRVNKPDREIPKEILLGYLREELPAFLNTVLKTYIPETTSRLRIPVLDSVVKTEIEYMSRDALESFIANKVKPEPGSVIPFDTFYRAFLATIPSTEHKDWSKMRVSVNIPKEYPRGRYGGGGSIYVGNARIEGYEAVKISTSPFTRNNKGYLICDLENS